MADGNKLFGGASQDSTKANTVNADEQAQVTEKESNALSGEGGKGTVPAFGKHGGGSDENNPLTGEEQVESLKEGAIEQSGIQQDGEPLDINALEAAQLVGADAVESDKEITQYTSHPIARLRVGRFQFDGGVLSLHGDDVTAFEKTLAASDVRTQNTVRKIDRSGGEVVARRLKSQMRSGVDTSDRGVPSPKPAQ